MVSGGMPSYNWNLTPTEYIQQALKGTARVVSDDTNCFNFVRATYPHLSSNVVYLPNYEDLGEAAAKVARTFSRELWRKGWAALVRQFY